MWTDLKVFLWGMLFVVAVPLWIYIYRHGPISIPGLEFGPLLGLLYDFQTLVTGVAALAAAAITVNAMHRTDSLASMRHKEAVELQQQALELQLRPSRLTVERMTHPHFNVLFEASNKLDDAIKDLERRLVDAKPWRSAQAAFPARECHNAVRKVAMVLESPQWLEASRYWSGTLVHDVAVLARHVDQAAQDGEIEITLVRDIHEVHEERRRVIPPQPPIFDGSWQKRLADSGVARFDARIVVVNRAIDERREELLKSSRSVRLHLKPVLEQVSALMNLYKV